MLHFAEQLTQINMFKKNFSCCSCKLQAGINCIFKMIVSCQSCTIQRIPVSVLVHTPALNFLVKARSNHNQQMSLTYENFRGRRCRRRRSQTFNLFSKSGRFWEQIFIMLRMSYFLHFYGFRNIGKTINKR